MELDISKVPSLCCENLFPHNEKVSRNSLSIYRELTDKEIIDCLEKGIFPDLSVSYDESLSHERRLKKKHEILYLTLKKEWFDRIKSGEKTIEYRELKDYWVKRLTYNKIGSFITSNINPQFYEPDDVIPIEFKTIVFRNGYQKNAPELKAKWIKTEVISDGLKTDLKANSPVFAIHFELLKGENN